MLANKVEAMKIKIIGYIAGSLQIIATIHSQTQQVLGGYWNYENILWLVAGLSLGAFIILLSTKLKI